MKIVKKFKGEHYNTVDFKQRHNFLRAQREAGFSLKDTRSFGFKCSKKGWKTCLSKLPRNLGILL